MSEQQQQLKTILKETFDAVSEGYDGSALRFFPESAAHMAAALGLRGDEHVLDVACGTGHASLAVARLLPRGRVVAVDFSSGMLDQARRKAARLRSAMSSSSRGTCRTWTSPVDPLT